jgi:hypothetical protein
MLYKQVDYSKVKTLDDVILILKNLNPKALEGTPEYESLKHLLE